jgi:putative ABC transport system permease protein
LINKLVFENLKHRPVRTLLSTIAIGIGVTMMLTLVGLSEGMLEDQKRRSKGVGADILVRPPGTSVIGLTSAPMNEKLLKFLAEMPEVEITTGTVVHPLGGVSTVTGIDYDSFRRMSGGFRFLDGGPFRNEFDVIVDQYYAQQHKLKVGDRFPLMSKDWRVAGIVEPGKLARLFVPIKLLQELTGNTGKLTVIYLKLKDASQTEAVIEKLKGPLPDYRIYSMEEFISQFSVSNLPELRTFMSVVITLAVIFGFLVVFLAMYTAVLERTREIGILKALGASPFYILGILVRETAMLALLGTVMGILFSFGTRAMVMNLIPGSLIQAIVPEWWPRAGAFTLAGALLGVLYPAIRAAKQDALESLSYE